MFLLLHDKRYKKHFQTTVLRHRQNIFIMKIDLRDFAILIIVRLDSIDRLENTLMVIEYLIQYFNTNIYVWEISAHDNHVLSRLISSEVKYEFHQDYDPILHRTKYINDLVKAIKEEYLAVWDADVIVPVEQVMQTAKYLRDGYEMVYPYKKYFYDTSYPIRKIYLEKRDINVFKLMSSFMKEMYLPNPVGGVFFANRQSYIDSGMEQELFYGWGVEDGERYNRWILQKRKMIQVEGAIYHLSHSRGRNSFISTEYDSIIKRRLLFSTKKGI